MSTLRITRSAAIPDPIRIARYEKAPELGPRILFFSGGTALNPLARHLIRYTHNSVHVITAFDSGGSSAKLRDAFHIPPVGDLRSRIMALADQSVKGNPAVVRLFAFRFPLDQKNDLLGAELSKMARGNHPLVQDVPYPMRDIICTHLATFERHRPKDFDLRGASIGNLILAGGYLSNNRDLDPVVFLFSKLVEARGTVVPVCRDFLELGAQTADGRRIVGQHRLTGKECPPLQSTIERLFLVDPARPEEEAQVDAPEDIRQLILQADLICFPMGSFFSSVLANLLPRGISEAVAAAGCPKVYVPNTGHDPEQYGLSLTQRVQRLLEYLIRGRKDVSPSQVLHLVLFDPSAGDVDPSEREAIRGLGVEAAALPLISPRTAPHLDEHLLVPALLSLC